MTDKYQIGDTFECTLRIKDIDIEFGTTDVEIPVYLLEVVELGEEVRFEDGGYFEQEDLDRAFDPHYIERERLQKIARLEQELRELKGGEV